MNYDDDEKSIFFTPPNANNQLFIHTLIVSSENSYTSTERKAQPQLSPSCEWNL